MDIKRAGFLMEKNEMGMGGKRNSEANKVVEQLTHDSGSLICLNLENWGVKFELVNWAEVQDLSAVVTRSLLSL